MSGTPNPNTNLGLRPCQICQQPARRLFTKRGYGVWACRQCGFLCMVAETNTASPVDCSKLYGESYYGGGEMTADTIARYNLAHILEDKLPQSQAAVRLIQRFKTGGRLLDIGCSAGVFVKAAGDGGFHACGIDVSAVAVQFAREQLGVDVQRTTLEDAQFGGQRFEVITL